MSVFMSKELSAAKDTLRDNLVESFLSTAIFGPTKEAIRHAVGVALEEYTQALLKQARGKKKDKDESKSSPEED
jgi:hypothetical protein